MNLDEAYKILEVPKGTVEAEAKKSFKKLAAKYHPDVNKDPDAESKFKKVNEAFQCVKDGKGNDRQSHNTWNRQQHQVYLENVELHIDISFKESVLGCKREVKYSRLSKCQSCNGAGEIRVHNGCVDCGGKGQITTQQRGMVFISSCQKCHGKSSSVECEPCKGNGNIHTDVSVHVSVPAGVINGNVLRLQQMGNYVGSIMGMMDQHTDAFCHIAVETDSNLSIDGLNVITTVIVSLIDALRGCNKSVKTIFGEKEIQINPQSRNRDEVIIPNHGVGGSGNQRVILDVQYPTNTDKLIGALIDEVI